MKKIFTFVFLLVLTFLQTKLYFHSGFPYTHDGENHLARFMNYKVAIKEGQIPPRFAPNLLNHYGYPVFNFNYPLANILSLPFTLLKTNPELTFKILVFIFIFIGGYFCKKWLDGHIQKKSSSFFGISLFLLAPFLSSAIFFRGNIGEIFGYLFLPFLFYTIDEVKRKRKVQWGSIVGLVAFSLSHNLSVVFSLPLLLIYSLVMLRKERKLWKIWFFELLMTFLFSAWFWIPAILEKGQTVVSEVNLVQEFSSHFVTFSQLFFSSSQFGFSVAGPIDSMGFSIGILGVITLIFGLPFSFINILKRNRLSKEQAIFSIFSLIIIILIFAQFGQSEPFWNVFSFLQIIQFPWRLTLFVMPLLAYLLTNLADTLGVRFKSLILIAIIIQVVSVFRLKPVDYFHRDNIDYEFFSQTTSTQNENRAKTFSYQDFADWKPSPSLVSESGEIEVDWWSGSSRRYQLLLTERTTVIEPTMYFSGWETKILDKGKIEKWKKIDYVLDINTQGRIAFQMPPGSYEIQTRFTQNTLPRILGNSMFILGLVVSGGIYLKGRKLRT